MCIIVNKICRMSIVMPKAFLFGIKIRNKLWKTRNNLLLTAKSVIKTLEPKIGKEETEQMVNF
jgi:hypothetical protein